MERPVRVRFTRVGHGWRYTVLAADSLTYLGEGWSAGKRRDAEDTFRLAAHERGWVTDEIRTMRMKASA